jgi:hypothetical protein
VRPDRSAARADRFARADELRRRADDEPQGIAVGVVEDLTDDLRLDERRAARSYRATWRAC